MYIRPYPIYPYDRATLAFNGLPRKVTYEEALAQTRLHHGMNEHDLQAIGKECRRLCEWFPELSLDRVKFYSYRWFWDKFGRKPKLPEVSTRIKVPKK